MSPGEWDLLTQLSPSPTPQHIQIREGITHCHPKTASAHPRNQTPRVHIWPQIPRASQVVCQLRSTAMSDTSQGSPDFCAAQALLPSGSGFTSLQALQPASQTYSLIPLQVCGLAYLPAGECRLHPGCSPQQRSHSPETPRIAWNGKAQF